jgi:ATP-binding cassette, subfamily B, bacterial
MVSIAHRLSTAEAADLVLVFDAGIGIVEVGTHDELVAAGGDLRRALRELDRQHPPRLAAA